MYSEFGALLEEKEKGISEGSKIVLTHFISKTKAENFVEMLKKLKMLLNKCNDV